MAMKTILHITSREAWQAAMPGGEYCADTLQNDGFMHCSTAAQVLKVANRFYHGQKNLMLLCIDRKALNAPLKYEPPVHPGSREPSPTDTIDLYPHVYGTLNLDAVVMAVEFPPKPDGTFDLPKVLEEIL
jgi:uncharacterized protein (DUF952 family)